MNLIDITLVAETLVECKVESMEHLFNLKIKSLDLEVLNLVNLSTIQTEVGSGNIAVITRACFEYPPKMIKSEIDSYTSKASERLELLFEELLSSEHKVFSLKSVVTKLL